jgi:RND family efflux transporter MFP subunit
MKIIAPIIIFFAAIFGVVILFLLRPEPKEVPLERPVDKVEVITVQPETIRLKVKSQGTLLPKVESQLAVEVSGRIIEMSPNFRAGNRVTNGDVLFRIDSSDYEAGAAARAADLATAKLSLAQEQALAEQAAADWEALGDGNASDLTLRKPQLAQAQALIASAEAALKRAERDLERTSIKAPFDGLILSKSVDLGQYVMANPANPVANIYSTDAAEVRLPLTLREASFLIDPSEHESRVRLHSEGPNSQREWAAKLVRFEATVDPTSRLIYAVAEIESPFEAGLRRGMFLEAEIEGKPIENVFVLPRYALRGSESIYIVTPENTLVTRPVEIARSNTEQVILSGGLKPGEQVATSPIAYFVENMPVEVIADK